MELSKTGTRLLATLAVAGSSTAHAATLTTIATFNRTNGAAPTGGLVTDAAGNLYGTTNYGGTADRGTVFKLAADTTSLTTLATFNVQNGSEPYGGLTADAAGNLYGTTRYGGASQSGIVFKLAAGTNALTTLATFNTLNGANPYAGVTADTAGNLYGAAYFDGPGGGGTVFKVAAGTNALTTLVAFNGANGTNPFGGVVIDGAGNLYGTTVWGGASGDGTVFKIAAATNALTTLATFTGANGSSPVARLTFDAAGNLYGTTFYDGPDGLGSVFKIDASTNALTTLVTFDDTTGAHPRAGVITDAAGNLYGTTAEGGAFGYGMVFKLAAGTNTLTTLATFDFKNGAYPRGELTADAAGNLYGTASEGGARGLGTVFQLTDTGFVVPEPTALSLLSLGSVLLRRRRS